MNELVEPKKTLKARNYSTKTLEEYKPKYTPSMVLKSSKNFVPLATMTL